MPYGVAVFIPKASLLFVVPAGKGGTALGMLPCKPKVYDTKREANQEASFRRKIGREEKDGRTVLVFQHPGAPQFGSGYTGQGADRQEWCDTGGHPTSSKSLDGCHVRKET